MKKKHETNPRLGRVGGEAVLEGVMMRCGDRYSIASRHEDGSISVENRNYVSLRKRNRFWNLPLVRGVVSLVESMKLSFKVLSISADALGMDMDEPESKFEKWLAKTFGDKVMNAIMGVAGFLGVVLGIGLFLVLPTLATKGLDMLLGLAGGALGVFKTLCEGLIRIGIFVGYILLVSLMPDIRRTFEYHGAEHKSIFCYESGEELTVANVKKQRRFHPRCGTSFMFVMLLIGIIIGFFIPFENIFARTACKLLLLPLTVGIGFEFLMYAGKHDNLLIRILSAPGLWMQRITTREPDESQIEVAIASLKSAMPDEFPPEMPAEPTESEASAEVSEENSSASSEIPQEDETSSSENSDA